MGVKISISGLNISDSKVLTGFSVKDGSADVKIKNSTIQGESELLNRTCIEGKDARLEVAFEQVNVGQGASMLNDMHVQGEARVQASSLIVAEGATVMDGEIVGDGEKVVVDLNGSNKDGDEIEVDNSPQKPKKPGLLDILFGKHKQKRNNEGVGNPNKKSSFKDNVSGKGEFRKPEYSNASTSNRGHQKPNEDKNQTR